MKWSHAHKNAHKTLFRPINCVCTKVCRFPIFTAGKFTDVIKKKKLFEESLYVQLDVVCVNNRWNHIKNVWFAW